MWAICNLLNWFVLILIISIGFLIIKVLRSYPGSDRKKRSLKIICSIILIVFISLLLVSLYPINYSYSYKFDRDYYTSSEEKALITVEELDISNLLNITRYDEEYVSLGYPMEYIYPQVIDNEVLNFYKDKSDRLRSRLIPVHIKYHYFASAQRKDTVIILNESNNSIIINDIEYYLKDWGDSSFQYGFLNISDRYMVYNHEKGDEISDGSVVINNSYVIEQRFNYSEKYSPLAGFGKDIHQIIVLDSSYNLKILIVRSYGAFIS